MEIEREREFNYYFFNLRETGTGKARHDRIGGTQSRGDSQRKGSGESQEMTEQKMGAGSKFDLDDSLRRRDSQGREIDQNV